MIEALGWTILAVACAFFMGYSINEGRTFVAPLLLLGLRRLRSQPKL